MATTEEAQQSFIDDAPISPIKERTNTLEHALSKRPETKDLLDRGILHAPPGVPASVQQRQHGENSQLTLVMVIMAMFRCSFDKMCTDLERSMAKDSLKTHLEKRPERDELVQSKRRPLHLSRNLFCKVKRSSQMTVREHHFWIARFRFYSGSPERT